MTQQTPAPIAKPRHTTAAPVPVTHNYPNGNPNAAYNPPGARNTDSVLPLHPTTPVEHVYTTTGPAPGDIAFRWIYGSICAATNKDPRIQILPYNDDTFILRENPAIHWEAPFTYLLFGNHGALLINTGATPEAAFYPLRAIVDALILRWCQARNRASIPLTIILTSAEHKAQNQGLAQFANRPNTTVAPTSTKTIDLGGRILDVLPTPGTHKDGLTLYDRYTQLLYTGDLLYPGRIQIANDRDYLASLTLLTEFQKTHPIKWIMGGHIRQMFIPGRCYPRFANFRPFEHTLQLELSTLEEARAHAAEIQGKPQVVFRADFILLNRVGPDEQGYRTSAEFPNIDVPYWLP
jgi:glyoxylase-like metal-dependent hydrolase (beta-lactamase superfamily II)